MATHRFREYFGQPQVAASAVASAFMPCPVQAFLSPAQLVYAQEVYRIAAERTREQLRPRRTRPAEFSAN